jgi:hypothetical protein
MSITTIRSVHCDRCHTWVENGIGTAADVRAFVKRCGWKVGLPGGEDLCDECAAVASAGPEKA